VKNKYICSLALLSLITLGSLSVNASNQKLCIDEGTVVYTGDDRLFLRESPELQSLRVGVLTKDESAVLTGNTSGDYVEVTSGDITGWVYNSKNLIKEDELEDYVLDNLDDFDVEVQVTKPTGIYTDLDSLKHDNLSYVAKATIKDTGKDITIYKSSTLTKYIEGISYLTEYIHVDKSTPIYDETGKVVKFAKVDSEYELVDTVDNKYEFTENDKSYFILTSDSSIVDKDTKISNKSNVDFSYNTMYDVEVLDDGVAKITINSKDYFISTDDLYIFYIVDRNSLAYSITSTDKTYKLEKIIKDKYYNISIKNDVSKTELSSYIKSGKTNLLVNFEEANEFDDSDDLNITNFEEHTTDSVYKDKYTYTWDNSSTEERNEIINYALSFLGNSYVFGGTSLTNGIDCSAYCMKILQHFGKKITRSTSSQIADGYGRKITADEIQPGDLVYYTRNGKTPYHVVMYLGDGKVVNASNKKTGICISNLQKDRILCIKNYID
jgi:hypothetical protein